MEQAEFYISPNPGEDLRPLARIASGGELSRIMLALKTLASTDAPGKTLIFDEVDAGIGGAVADVVGARLQTLGRDVPGPVHHAPAADCRVRRHALPDREERPGRPDRDRRRCAWIGVRAGSRARADDWRRRRRLRRSCASATRDARLPALHGARAKGESETKGESERSLFDAPATIPDRNASAAR